MLLTEGGLAYHGDTFIGGCLFLSAILASCRNFCYSRYSGEEKIYREVLAGLIVAFEQGGYQNAESARMLLQ